MGSPHIRTRKGNVMTQASEDLSVAKLFAEREERRRHDQDAAERLARPSCGCRATFALSTATVSVLGYYHNIPAISPLPPKSCRILR
jgi:hypothetical protein